MKYIKSPLNYTGGKYKLLSQILPLFPSDINKFVDLFAGGCNVAINVKANEKICNEIDEHLITLFEYFKSNDSSTVIDSVKNVIKEYGLSDTTTYGYEYYGCDSSSGVAKYNKEKYLKLREDYNKDTINSLYFFVVVMFAFSNQIRFNSDGHFNMPVNKRDFNKNVEKNTIKFVDELDESYTFVNYDFRDMDLSNLTKDDMVYCDPPYLLTLATYNENGAWTEKDQRDLLDILDGLNDRGVRFALSNVFESKGKSNDILKEWSKKYNVHYLDANYGNCNHQKKNKCKDSTIEVLITNY